MAPKAAAQVWLCGSDKQGLMSLPLCICCMYFSHYFFVFVFGVSLRPPVERLDKMAEIPHDNNHLLQTESNNTAACVIRAVSSVHRLLKHQPHSRGKSGGILSNSLKRMRGENPLYFELKHRQKMPTFHQEAATGESNIYTAPTGFILETHVCISLK